MSNLADIISQKREDSDPETNSFDEADDGFESETPQQHHVEEAPRPPISNPSSSSSIPKIPQRPVKKQTSESSSTPTPVIPKRPTRSQSPIVPPHPKRSESPIIPPRPKKSSESSKKEQSSDETEKTVPDLLKSTIEKIPGIGNLTKDENNEDDNTLKNDKESVPEPSKGEIKPEEIVIPPRPKKSSSSEEETAKPIEESKSTNTPEIPARPTHRPKSKSVKAEEEPKNEEDAQFPEEEKKTPLASTSEESTKADLIVEDNSRDIPVISNDKEKVEEPLTEAKQEDVSESPKDEIVEVSKPVQDIKTESEAFDVSPVEIEDKPGEIITEADVVEHSHDTVKDGSEAPKSIETEADAIEKLEEQPKVEEAKEPKEESPLPKVPQRPSKRPTKITTPSVQEASVTSEDKADNVEESTDDIISKTNEELQNIQAHFSEKKSSTSSIPPRPIKKASTSSSNEIFGLYTSDSQDDSTKPKPKSTKAPPPPVPKKPSSKIAAFQEMLKRNQEQERQQQSQSFQRSERSDSNDSTDRSKFKQNLNGLFALPGMARPGAPMPGMFKQEESESKNDEEETEDEPKEVKQDVRRSRAKGPRGKRTAKVEKIEIPDHRVIKVIDIWSSGLESDAKVTYENTKESETKSDVITDDIDDIELINPVEEKDKVDESLKPNDEDLKGYEKGLKDDTETEVEELETKSTITKEEETPAPSEVKKEDKGYESDNEDVIKDEEDDEEDNVELNPSIQSIKSKGDSIPDASIRSIKSETLELDDDGENDETYEKVETPEAIDEFVDAKE